MSEDGEVTPAAPAPPAWERLELAGERVRMALGAWRSRALEAEAEVERLRIEIEGLADQAPPVGSESREIVRQLRAENAALRSRLGQARRRVGTLLAWTDALEESR